jgi:23S rRNA pseudouridine2605 synthase
MREKIENLDAFLAILMLKWLTLKRVSYGKIDLDMLKPGKHRFLEATEYAALRDYLEFEEGKKGDDQ